MENRDINDTLSDQQRIYLIGKILSSKGLSGVLEAVDAIKDGFGVEIPGLERKLSEGEKINQINYKKSSEPKDIIEAPVKEPVIEPVINSSITTPKEASIYRDEAKALVEQDRLDHPVVENQETISGADPVVPQADETCDESLNEHPKVLERVKNNPWSGIETVSPGQLKL
ncbi:MAG: hypothetical protein SOT91_04735 [Bacilli bacterium]|nr:hypothetical protein [Clostridium sp.]MDY2804651.1 hypothetical protein [Bacilli bacterium]